MINFKSYCSGSSGNFNICYNDETKIIIDFGISYKKAQKYLDFKISSFDGVLCTHSHFDHSKGLKDVTKKGLDCYSSKDVFEIHKIKSHRVHIIKPLKQFKINTLKILPFPLKHDVPNMGFLIESDSGGKMVYICDSHYCGYKFKDVNIIAIECNYALDILENNIKQGLLHQSVRDRVLKSHFSLSNVKEFLIENDLSKLEKIYLLHLSGGNSDPDRFKNEIMALTGIPTVC